MELLIITAILALSIGMGILWGRITLKKHLINKAKEIDQLDELHLVVEWNGPINFSDKITNPKYEERSRSVETLE